MATESQLSARETARKWPTRRALGSPRAPDRRRTGFAVFLALMVAAPLASIALAGWPNLETLLQRPLLFHGLATVPVALGTLGLVMLLAPRLIRINIVLFVVLWLGAEVVLAVGARPVPVSEGEPRSLVKSGYYRADPVIGYALEPDNVARHRSRFDGRLEFDVTYRIDGSGRRITPAVASGESRGFALFFGGSNTFGEGLGQTETLPAAFSRRVPGLRAYNFGLHGYGPAQALDLVRLNVLEREVVEGRGQAFFLVIPDHMARVVGASNVATTWGRKFSHYRLDSNGRPQRHGNFTTGRPLTTVLYALAIRSRLFAGSGLRLPLRYGDADYRLAAAIFAALRDEIAETLDLSGFTVVLPPVHNAAQQEVMRRLMAALDAQKVDYLDLANLYDALDPAYRVAEHNYHLSALAADELAAAIAEGGGRSGNPRGNGRPGVPTP